MWSSFKVWYMYRLFLPFYHLLLLFLEDHHHHEHPTQNQYTIIFKVASHCITYFSEQFKFHTIPMLVLLQDDWIRRCLGLNEIKWKRSKQNSSRVVAFLSRFRLVNYDILQNSIFWALLYIFEDISLSFILETPIKLLAI